MRRVGGELGVPAGTLYSYVASKDDLLELMANELVGLTLAQKPLPEDWREALCELSRRMHAAFVTHPWALEVFARRPRMGPNSILRAKQLARAVSSLELEPDELWTLLAIVDDYVIGNALRMAIGAHERSFDGTLTGSDLVEFPELAALPTAELTRTHLERFETGLRSVLNGVEQEFLARRRAC
jgi:AcrR family transcriptional regulator